MILVRGRCLLLLSFEFLIDAQNIIINYIPHILQVEKKPVSISIKGALHVIHQTNYLHLNNSIDRTYSGAVVVMIVCQLDLSLPM